MSASNFFSVLFTAGFCALWTCIFYYCINIWPESVDGHAQVITFMTYAAGFLMVGKFLLLTNQLFDMICGFNCLGFRGCVGCLTCMAATSSFFFFLVWSIMGANWLQDQGLGDNLWFKGAAITTCVFTFLFSWGILVVIVLALVIMCCFLAFAANVVDQAQKEAEEAEKQGGSGSDQIAKKEESQARIEKMRNTLGSFLSKVPGAGDKLQTLMAKGTEKFNKPKQETLKHEVEEEDTKLVGEDLQPQVENLDVEDKTKKSPNPNNL